MKRSTSGPILSFTLGIFDGPHATPAESDEGPIYLGIDNITPDGRLNLTGARRISEQDFPRWTRRVTPVQDDIVFTYEATLHRYAIIPEGFRGCLGRRLAVIKPDKNKVYPRFLHYYLLTPKWRSVVESNVISGATVDRIPIKRFPSFPVEFPSLETQRKKADIIAGYDSFIENNQRRIQLLEQSVRMLYKEWFVHLRFPGHEHVKVRMGVPHGWERKSLGKIAQLNYGRGLKGGDRIPGAFPVFGSSGIVGTHEQALVKGPGIVVGRKGNVGSVFWSETDFFPIDTTYYIDRDKCTHHLYYALLHTTFMSTDVAVPGLNRDLAHSKKILMPDKNTLDLFEETVKPIHRQIALLTMQSEGLAKARDILLPKLMSVEVEV